MRGRTVLAVGLILVIVAVTAAAVWMPFAAESAPDAGTGQIPPVAAAKKPPRPPRPPRVRTTVEPPVETDSDVSAAWDAAVATYKAGQPVEALTSLAPWRHDRPEFFAEPARAALLAEMEKAALAALSRAVRSGTPDDARKLAATLANVLLDEKMLAALADLAAAAERRAGAAQPGVGGDIVERADALADKQAISRHLQRFADATAAAAVKEKDKKPDKDWVDQQLAAVNAANQKLKEPDPVAIVDPVEAEKRRLDQLEKLRQRDMAGLLDHIDGALAWLALHQAEDGHFGADATAARCKELGHNPACAAPGTRERYPLAATGLAVLAYLDFRDQDVKRLFEPTLARGIKWILGQQQQDGSFKDAGRSGYPAAIGMMALGQAAASSGNADVKLAIQKAIDFYAKHHGPDGGYWYSLDPATVLQQDLSVTGWYVQAIESGVNAGATIPEGMREMIDTRFLGAVWHGKHQFSYHIGDKESESLSSVGMLSMSILRPSSPREYADPWREFLGKGPPPNNVYALYYGVRVLLFLDGKLSDKWRAELNTLASKQTVKGAGAGMISFDAAPARTWDDRAFKANGVTISTAFATLTLEHSLYRR